jgi:hypothetical protein
MRKLVEIVFWLFAFSVLFFPIPLSLIMVALGY